MHSMFVWRPRDTPYTNKAMIVSCVYLFISVCIRCGRLECTQVGVEPPPPILLRQKVLAGLQGSYLLMRFGRYSSSACAFGICRSPTVRVRVFAYMEQAFTFKEEIMVTCVACKRQERLVVLYWFSTLHRTDSGIFSKISLDMPPAVSPISAVQDHE